jgi:hypothetical protein
MCKSCSCSLSSLYKKSVRTSQETHYVSATATNRLMLFKSLFIVTITGNTQIHCVGRMRSLSVFKQVVYIVTTGLIGLICMRFKPRMVFSIMIPVFSVVTPCRLADRTVSKEPGAYIFKVYPEDESTGVPTKYLYLSTKIRGFT